VVISPPEVVSVLLSLPPQLHKAKAKQATTSVKRQTT
jgi:hypothetical protein